MSSAILGALPMNEFSPKVVRCPTCGGDSHYAVSNTARPFCSDRCKNMDFGAWASEQFAVPSEAPPDDVPFGDAHFQ
jgi:endogenous inhibitor of DNA gyrase (YacG/DUF329 family)